MVDGILGGSYPMSVVFYYVFRTVEGSETVIEIAFSGESFWLILAALYYVKHCANCN